MKERRLRIGLTSPESPVAREIRSAFHEGKFPVSRFVPLGVAAEEGKLSEIDGEAEFLQVPSRETVGDLDFLILAGSPSDAQARLHARESRVAIFDLGDSPPAGEGCAALLAAAGASPVSASFTILVPAAERGNPGVEELFSQAADSLNFRPTTSSIFGNRLAFNLFRDDATAQVEREIREALEKLFPPCAVSIVCARAGIFHGYAGTAVLRYASADQAKGAAEALGRSQSISTGREPGFASPAAATENAQVRLDPPSRAGDTISMWFAWDGLSLAARKALAAARLLIP